MKLFSQFLFVFICFAFLQCRTLFLYHPSHEIIAFPSQIGIDFENNYFYTSDNLKLHAWYIKSKQDLGTVIFFHGNAGNITGMLNTIRLIHGLGFNIFIMDYRGYGESEGFPYFTGLKLDALASYKYVIDNLKEKPDRIIIWGRSLGGSVAAFLASEKLSKVLILESTFISLKKISSDYFFLLPYLAFIKEDEYNTLDYTRKSKCPVLIIHSLDDETIPFRHGQYLYENTNQSFFLKISGPHNFGFMISEEIYLKGIRNFLIKFYSK